MAGNGSPNITPSDVTSQFRWALDDIRSFATSMFEDSNDHNLAFSLWSIEAGDYDLACEFLQIERRMEQEGIMSPDIAMDRDALVDRLRALGFPHRR